MDGERRKRIRKKITLCSIAALVIVLAIMVGGLMTGILNGAAFQAIASLYLLGYWAVTDILEPRLTKELEGITAEQKNAYLKYAGIDLAGFCGVILFILTVQESGSSSIGMLGLIVYVLSLNFKRRYRNEFLHPAKKENEECPEEGMKINVSDENQEKK